MGKTRNVLRSVGHTAQGSLRAEFPAHVEQEFGKVKQFLSKYLSVALGLEASLNSQQIPDPPSPFPESCVYQNHSRALLSLNIHSVFVFSQL